MVRLPNRCMFFINAGLAQIEKTEINVFELGFGTGLNALLACGFALQQHKTIHYQSIELFPLKPIEAANLNYAEKVKFEGAAAVFLRKCMLVAGIRKVK